MDYLVERLEWDSSFFGYEIAKVTLQNIINEELLANMIHESEEYRLVYIFSEYELSKTKQLKKFSNIYLVDIKLTFSLKIIKEKLSSQEISKEYRLERINEDSENLKSLVFLSGKHSRFFKDHNFVKDEFKRLYQKWIERSLSNDSGRIVLGIKDADKVIAFVSIKVMEQVVLIELIAVDESYQGKGIGKMLVNEVLAFCVNKNIENVRVVTQSDNESACRLYASCGMHLNSKQFIYHLWNR